jgi:uncharacterized protein (DUF2249 family)
MPTALLDLRQAPLAERHRPIFSAFDALSLGAQLELADARELESLRELMEATRPHYFAWQPLETGPVRWRVRVIKTPEGAGASGCEACPCNCGGARLGSAC